MACASDWIGMQPAGNKVLDTTPFIKSRNKKLASPDTAEVLFQVRTATRNPTRSSSAQHSYPPSGQLAIIVRPRSVINRSPLFHPVRPFLKPRLSYPAYAKKVYSMVPTPLLILGIHLRLNFLADPYTAQSGTPHATPSPGIHSPHSSCLFELPYKTTT